MRSSGRPGVSEILEKINFRAFVESIIAVAVGFLIGAIILLAFNYNPVEAYTALFRGGLASIDNIAATLHYSTPILLTALTFAIGARTGIFNIGAESSFYLGAIAAVAFTNIWDNLWFGLLMGMALGALWALPAALLKVYRGVHEVISTIMLNWIGWYLISWLIVGPYADPTNPIKTIKVPENARLPTIGNTVLSWGFIIAVVAAILVYFILWHTTLGFGMRASGYNQRAARYGGISPRTAMMWSFIIGGMASGLGGAMKIMGEYPGYAISQGGSNIYGFGFDGIGVSLVGRNHPLGIILSAIFFGMLKAGTSEMQQTGVPLEIVKVIQGIIIITVAIPGLYDLLKKGLGRAA
ncbi:ABC transporter permease [Thermococcus waiotapuensis]|uniref:ABC transporter permease n=1 Tax=Thermococcus waiotapuensis TaxID=90909 RepID=A0AAE4NUI1_9EURY|nr:ABC transporter permease [Thermococcus waiotapuensis]MDV3103586.1 ABC transporter permease [Thermococcus waiotapuensis]